MHGAPCRFSDPARFSLAHGGKDRHPYPVPILVYDRTIAVLKSALHKARLGREEELGALKRLDDQSRRLERHASGASVDALIAQERRESHEFGGRSVFGWEPTPERAAGRPTADETPPPFRPTTRLPRATRTAPGKDRSAPTIGA
jgi:uncharacterized protein